MENDQQHRSAKGRLPVAGLGLIVVLATVPFLNTLHNEFARDDYLVIVHNPSIESIGNIPELFTSGYYSRYFTGDKLPDGRPFRGRSYRPLITTSYALDYAVAGHNPVWYHIVNVLAHTAVSTLVYVAAFKLFGHAGGALVAAGVFAVHPLHTEAVAGISNRPELFAAAFFMLAWVWYLDGRPTYRLASLSAYLLALLSKEHAATLVGILVLTDLYRARGAIPVRARRGEMPHLVRERIRWYGLYLLVLLGYLVLRISILGEALPDFRVTLEGPLASLDNPLKQAALWPRLWTAVEVAGRYLWLMIWPRELSADYSYNQIPILHSPDTSPVFLALLAWTGLIGLAWGSYVWGKARAFLCVGFTVCTFLPVSNLLFPIGTIMGERLFYLPSVGLCLLIGLGWQRVIEWSGHAPDRTRPVRWTAGALVTVLVVLLAVRTVMRNLDWRDNLVLFRAAATVSPNSFRVHKALGEHFLAAGLTDQAIDSYRTALVILEEPAIHRLLGGLYLQKGLTPAAITEYRKTLELDSGDAEVYAELGYALMLDGKLEESVEALNKAIGLHPWSGKAHYNLGLARAKREKWAEAAQAYLRATNLQPDFMEAWYALGLALENTDRFEEAAEAYEKALEIKPKFKTGHRRLADLYAGKLGNQAKASLHAQQAGSP